MPQSATRIIAGFIAGALAVAIFHQAMYLVIKQLGWPLQAAPWDLARDPAAYGLPRLVNLSFWGGLWGIVFALMIDRMPGGPDWLKGFIFGVIFPMLIGTWLVVALIKGRPILGGLLTDWDFLRLRTGFLLNGVAFGIGLGILYPLLARAIGVARAQRG